MLSKSWPGSGGRSSSPRIAASTAGSASRFASSSRPNSTSVDGTSAMGESMVAGEAEQRATGTPQSADRADCPPHAPPQRCPSAHATGPVPASTWMSPKAIGRSISAPRRCIHSSSFLGAMMSSPRHLGARVRRTGLETARRHRPAHPEQFVLGGEHAGTGSPSMARSPSARRGEAKRATASAPAPSRTAMSIGRQHSSRALAHRISTHEPWAI